MRGLVLTYPEEDSTARTHLHPPAARPPLPFPALSPTLPSGLLRLFHDRAMRHGMMRIAIDARRDFRTEIADQALHGPGRRIAERADRMTFDLFRYLEQHEIGRAHV